MLFHVEHIFHLYVLVKLHFCVWWWYVWWVTWGWSVEEFLEVLCPSVELCLLSLQVFPIFVFHRQFWFAVPPTQLLCCIIDSSEVTSRRCMFRLLRYSLYELVLVSSQALLHFF